MEKRAVDGKFFDKIVDEPQATNDHQHGIKQEVRQVSGAGLVHRMNDLGYRVRNVYYCSSCKQGGLQIIVGDYNENQNQSKTAKHMN